MTSGIAFLADAPELVEPVASTGQLGLAFLAGIAVIVVLITVVKLHPFLGLIFGAVTVGVVAGEEFATVLASFANGFGKTAASVGILIALGAMFAKLLADSGGASSVPAQRGSDDQDLVDHGDGVVGQWAGGRVASRPGDLTRVRRGRLVFRPRACRACPVWPGCR